MGQRKKQQERTSEAFIIVTTAMIVFAVVAGFFSLWNLLKYEEGILDVCAKQQDAYVQLVLDQINLKQNRDDKEIIEEIIGTLDASSNKYWAFSKDETMLFVKDVLETNKYQGLTTATYYASDSAGKFIRNLSLNRVSHAEINVQDKSYVVSGVCFEYAGQEYRLCLLTNRDVLLDNNSYLGAKIGLITWGALVLIAMVLVSAGVSKLLQNEREKNTENERVIHSLNESLVRLNAELTEKNFFGARENVWSRDALPAFVDKLRERDACPITLALFDVKEEKTSFLNMANVLLDEYVLRFSWSEEEVLFVMLRVDKKAAKTAIRPLEKHYGRAVVLTTVLDPEEFTMEMLEKTM